MKRLLFQLATIICLFFTIGNANAQGPFTEDQKKLIDQIKKKMDETELGLMTESDVTFGEAKAILENVSAEDLEIEKAFMKGSTPKAEKKAVNVKRNRIEAAKLYEKGYNMVFEACESRLKQIKFPDDTKATKSKDISSQANETMTGAVTKGDDYKYLKDKDLETLRYDDLKSRIEGVNKLFIEGINQEFEAWKIYFSQFAAEPEPVVKKDSVPTVDTTKKVEVATVSETIEPVKSENVVETTLPIQQPTETSIPTQQLTETTLPAQQPSGTNNLTAQPVSNNVITEKEKEKEVKQAVETVKTAVQPTTKITATSKNAKVTKPTNDITATTKETEPKTAKKTSKKESSSSNDVLESSANIKGTVYMVQLLAIQRGKLSKSAKKELYSGPKKMYEDYENDLYKYRVGDFTTEEEAIKFKQEYGKGCFVLKLIDGKRQMDYINK
jgi:hypothetical protein